MNKRDRVVVSEVLPALKRVCDYLETANGIISEDGGDEEDYEDARDVLAIGREALDVLSRMADIERAEPEDD